jgi:hypothetical protein
MAVSTPLPVPGATPVFHEPPSIVASAPGVASAAELFVPSSLPTGDASAVSHAKALTIFLVFFFCQYFKQWNIYLKFWVN